MTSTQRGRVFGPGELAGADLVVDAVYEGGHAGNMSDDPIHVLLPVGNQGGFRFAGPTADVRLAVLYSDLSEPGWPDELDSELGRFTYYGDNRHPGHGLHETPRKGNLILRDAFSALHRSPPARDRIPPFFVFTRHRSRARAVVFRGLAVPGADATPSTADLVAVWRSTAGERFQNYHAVFTILDVPVVERRWLDQLAAGASGEDWIPAPLRQFREHGRYRALRAPAAQRFRSKEQQLPQTAADKALLKVVYDFFPKATDFERCAAAIWQMCAGRVEYEVTRPVKDGGRDAIGLLRIGPESDAVGLDFALEAKRYAPTTAVGVADLARLVSRIRHRMFGVLVTTSYLHEQAYSELKDDGHPIVVIAGADIVGILRRNGLASKDAVHAWLVKEFSPAA